MNSLHDMSKIRTQLSKTRQIIASGFTLIELIIVISIVAILSAAALDRLFWYQGQAEKAAMDYTANMIKSGLWMSAANLMMSNNAAGIAALEKRNPINLLAQKPDNYLGEIQNPDIASLEPGNWLYDLSKNQLVYIVKHRRGFYPAITGDFTVRYRAQLTYGEIETSPDHKVPYLNSVAFNPLSHYTWH